MEPWKGMLWVAFVLVSVAILVDLLDLSIQSIGGIGVLIVVVLFAILSYIGTKKGYEIGRDMGEQRREENDS